MGRSKKMERLHLKARNWPVVAENVGIHDPMFRQTFEEKHLATLPQSRVKGSGLQKKAIDTYEERSRQEARRSQQVPLHSNTVVGMSPSTRRHLENTLRSPQGQRQLSTSEVFTLPLPERGFSTGWGPHRAQGIDVTRSHLNILDQPQALRVSGAPIPGNPQAYQVQHLSGVIPGARGSVPKERRGYGAPIKFDSEDDD